MAKKKSANKPPKEEVFKTNTFSILKGVAVAAATAKADVKPAAVIKPQTAVPDDSELFLDAMSDVKPLKASAAGLPAVKNRCQPKQILLQSAKPP